MKKRLKEIEDEAGALREMQAKVEKEMGAVQGCFLGFIWSEFLIIFLNNFDLNSIEKENILLMLKKKLNFFIIDLNMYFWVMDYCVCELLFPVSLFVVTFFFLDVYEDSSSASATQEEKEEVDSRSIYVGNVRFINPFLCLIFLNLFYLFICFNRHIYLIFCPINILMIKFTYK